MSSVPAYRATAPQGVLEAVQSIDPALGARLRDELGEALCGRVGALGPMDWVAAQDHVRVMEVAAALLGDGGARRLGAMRTASAAESAMFRMLLVAIRRAAGGRAAEVLRYVPLGWDLATRNCGSLQFVSGVGRSLGTVRLVGFPADLLTTPTMGEFMAGMVEQLLGMFGIRVVAHAETRDGVCVVDVLPSADR